MSTTLFKEVGYSLAVLINNIQMGSIGLPDIQRPFVWKIKVGTSVARRPPRRSRRAELPHRAPQECAQVEL